MKEGRSGLRQNGDVQADASTAQIQSRKAGMCAQDHPRMWSMNWKGFLTGGLTASIYATASSICLNGMLWKYAGRSFAAISNRAGMPTALRFPSHANLLILCAEQDVPGSTLVWTMVMKGC